MKPEVWESALLLPSIRRFIDRVLADIGRGRCVVVLFPPQCELEGVWNAIYQRLFEADYLCSTIDPSTLESPPASVEELASLLAPVDGIAATAPLSDMLGLPGFPDVVWIKGVGTLKETVRAAWLRLLQKWSEALQSLPPRATSPCRLCLLEPARSVRACLPPADVRLAIHLWFGFPSALELRLLCHELTCDSPVETAWRECLVSGVAAGDLALAAQLWDVSPRGLGEVAELLFSFREGKSPETCQPTGLQPAQRRTRLNGAELPPAMWQGWAHGMLVGSPEYGTELHPAALDLERDTKQLDYRLWRGQAPLLLPLADQVRRAVCGELIRDYGQKWYLRWCNPRREDDLRRLEADPLDAELGYLVTLAGNFRLLRQGTWHGLERAWAVRNNLAHYKPVDWQTFESFMQVAL